MGIATVATSLVMEGGALEVNGKGSLLQVESVTLGRNKHLSKPAIEKELCRVLGQKKLIWLKEGVADDPLNGSNIADNYFGFGTGGHIDEFCRFADAPTILLAWVTDEDAKQNPVHRLTQTRMQANFEILRQATDQDGKLFRIVKFPVPEMEALSYSMDTTSENGKYFRTFKPALQQGDTWYYVPAASYLNYIISNRVILVPAYWEKGKPLSIKKKDEEALALFKRYFPGYKIAQLNPYNLNRGGGGMHCLVQQQPK